MGKKFINIKLSFLAIVVCFLVALTVHFDHKVWRNSNAVIANEAMSYYTYLPAFFIFQDASLHYVSTTSNQVRDKIYYDKTPEGKRVIKKTMGVAYLYFPFFIVANQFTPLLGYTQNGYTKLYEEALVLSSLFYYLLGLYFLLKIVRKYASDLASFWTVLIIGLGTNILNYVTNEPLMSHVYSFCTITLFIFYTIKWSDSKKEKHLSMLLFLLGINVLINPVNLFLILFPVALGAESWRAIINKVKDLVLPLKKLPFRFFYFILPILPQLLYWKYNTGEWFYFELPAGESYFFSQPKILEGLFGFRKGWLVYTPLMSLFFIGLLFNFKKFHKDKAVITVFFATILFITYSCWCWWYGGSFSARALIDYYAIFAIPIAIVLHQVFVTKKAYLKVIIPIVISGFIYLNQVQLFQYRSGLLHWDSMTKEAYWEMFLKTDPDQETKKRYLGFLERPNYKLAKQGDR